MKASNSSTWNDDRFRFPGDQTAKSKHARGEPPPEEESRLSERTRSDSPRPHSKVRLLRPPGNNQHRVAAVRQQRRQEQRAACRDDRLGLQMTTRSLAKAPGLRSICWRTDKFTCRAGCKERDVSKNRNARPGKFIGWFGVKLTGWFIFPS